MTSNLGTEIINEYQGLGFTVKKDKSGESKEVEDKIMKILKEHFRPEFLNRLDDIIIFNSLTKEDIKKIVELQLAETQERISKKNITIKFDSKIKDYLAEKGYDPIYGARPLKRLIQQLILNPLAQETLKQKRSKGDKNLVFRAEVVDNSISVRRLKK
jgi:ATP-dependent Clp protease ATP-binding subunit ClpA